MKSLTIIYCLLVIYAKVTSAQKVAGFEVELPSAAIVDFPVSINLDELTLLPDSSLQLVGTINGKRTNIPYQVERGTIRLLHFIIPQGTISGKKLQFELITGKQPAKENLIFVVDTTGALTIRTSEKQFIRYNHKIIYPPAGVDTVFKRSGFIHPLYAPHGQALTRVSPSDHYHHFGLWNPWTKVLVDTDTVDFWNLSARKGTVRFAKTISVSEGPVYGGYQVLHEHIAFNKGQEKIAINELQSVWIYNPGNPDYYIADITIQLNPVYGRHIVLKEYRYGGLGWRATEKWHKDNSETLTSEGKTRKEADGSKARWCIVQGSLDDDYGGVVMMSYPTNYNHPEPLRIWPESSNGRGDVYANFSPTKDKDWELKNGQQHVLKYRLLVFNGKMSAEKAEAAWRHFANGGRIIVNYKKNQRL